MALDGSATPAVTHDMRATGLFQRGEVLTTDGMEREDESFPVIVKAYDGGVLVDTYSSSVTTFGGGLFQFFDFYAAGVDEVVFQMSAAGAAALTFTEVVDESIELVEFNVFTDPLKLVTIDGSILLDGATPLDGRIDSFEVGSRRIVDTPAGPAFQSFGTDVPDFDDVDADGNGSYTFLAPPEAATPAPTELAAYLVVGSEFSLFTLDEMSARD